MLKKFMILVISGLLLATFVSFAFAQCCKTSKEIRDQKASCCQCCCCNCAK